MEAGQRWLHIPIDGNRLLLTQFVVIAILAIHTRTEDSMSGDRVVEASLYGQAQLVDRGNA